MNSAHMTSTRRKNGRRVVQRVLVIMSHCTWALTRKQTVCVSMSNRHRSASEFKFTNLRLGSRGKCVYKDKQFQYYWNKSINKIVPWIYIHVHVFLISCKIKFYISLIVSTNASCLRIPLKNPLHRCTMNWLYFKLPIVHIVTKKPKCVLWMTNKLTSGFFS